MLITFFLACVMISCKNKPKKDYNAGVFNPIGRHYDDVVDYLERNNIDYDRCFLRFRNCLYTRPHVVDSTDAIQIAYYFCDDNNICDRWMRFYNIKQQKSIIKWLKNNYKQMPNDEWQDSKQDMNYSLEDVWRKHGQINLICNAEKYCSNNNQDNKIIADYTQTRIYYPAANRHSEWFEMDNRFVIPINDKGINGDIVYFRPKGKMITYKRSSDSNGMKYSSVKGCVVSALNEHNVPFMFFIAYDVSFVSLMFKDMYYEFSNTEE